MERPRTVAEFYSCMMKTRDIRRRITHAICSSNDFLCEDLEGLRRAHSALRSLPEEDGRFVLVLEDQRTISLDLGYEISELEKDIFYLSHSEEEFLSFLEGREPLLKDDVSSCLAALESVPFKNFITDRDGTVNNYCGRYSSSIQSVYNAVFLTRFARTSADHSVVLTSAPLDNIGLVDLCVNPPGVFMYAGSKGREYFTSDQQRRQFPIESYKQGKLDELNAQLRELVKDPQYEKYSLIGSGLQFKFGQTTIARQDISHSIPEEESLAFLRLIDSRVAGIDPKHELFRIEDTGKDIEIILTLEADDTGATCKDFDKGDGIAFLNHDSGLNMEEGASLICGDTASDIPMVSASLSLSRETHAVFVTTDILLREKVSQVCPDAVFVSSPDALVIALCKLAHLKSRDERCKG